MTHRVVTPVNLKERIALLQQKASGNPSILHATAPSPSSAGASPSTSVSASSSGLGTSGFALRDRIARFEEKGGVPVPRGSFGIGAPPPALEQTHEGKAARKRGELYGNRIASIPRSRPGQTSPPSALRPHFTGNADVIAASSRSLIPSSSASSGLDVPGDGSPVRKRCLSTSSLATARPASASVFPAHDSIMLGTFDGDGDTNDGLAMSGSNDSQPQPQFARRSSISGSDAVQSFVSDASDGAQLSSTSKEEGTQFSPSGPSQESNIPESVPMPVSSNDDHGHVIGEDHQDDVPGQRAVNVAVSPEEAPPSDSTEESIRQEDVQDESSVETPVVATFSPSSTSPPFAKEDTSNPDTLDVPSEDPELSDVSTPFTDASSPMIASFEVGERVRCELRKYIVMPPSGSKEAAIAAVLEQQNESTGDSEGSRENASPENTAESALGISGTAESQGSTETVSPVTTSLTTDVAERSPISPQTTGANSIRRRNPPAPIAIQHEKGYSEPSLDPKVGPKSFHAVVHSKTMLSARENSGDPVLRSTFSRPQVNIVRPRDDTPATPGSPDLSALLEQAMYLEQRLVHEDVSVGTPRPEETTFQNSRKSETESDVDSKPQISQVAFPRSGGGRGTRDDTAPDPPPKSPNPRTLPQVTTNVGPGSRKSWSRSSGNASSEDSVPVLTPPSPTFDLAPTLFEEPQQIPPLEIAHPGVDEHVEHGEGEGRRSISSVLSSPGRSARKKVLSLFSRSGLSSSTLTLPDDLLSESPHSHDTPGTASTSSSVSACPSSTLLPSPPIRETIVVPPTPSSAGSHPPSSPLPIPRTKQDTPDVPRPISVVSTTSAYSSAPSPLAIELFDSFPDVPRSVPNSFEQDRFDEPDGIELRLEIAETYVKEEVLVKEEDPESPPPPTPPPKEIYPPVPPRIKVNPLPPVPPPPKSPPPYSQLPAPPSPPRKDDISSSSITSASASATSLSLPRKSKSKTNLRLPHLPYLSSHRSPGYGHEREKSDSSSSDFHAPPPVPPIPPSSFPNSISSSSSSSTSIFGAISRTLSSRRRRKSSIASALSISTGHGSYN